MLRSPGPGILSAGNSGVTADDGTGHGTGTGEDGRHRPRRDPALPLARPVRGIPKRVGQRAGRLHSPTLAVRTSETPKRDHSASQHNYTT